MVKVHGDLSTSVAAVRRVEMSGRTHSFDAGPRPGRSLDRRAANRPRSTRFVVEAASRRKRREKKASHDRGTGIDLRVPREQPLHAADRLYRLHVVRGRLRAAGASYSVRALTFLHMRAVKSDDVVSCQSDRMYP